MSDRFFDCLSIIKPLDYNLILKSKWLTYNFAYVFSINSIPFETPEYIITKKNINNPCDICVSKEQNRIIVLNYCFPINASIFNIDGDCIFQKKYNEQIPQYRKPNMRRYYKILSSDNEEELIIYDLMTMQICIVNKDTLNVIRYFKVFKNTSYSRECGGITYSNNKIFVSSEYKILVFDIFTGDLIQTWGKYGNLQGEFIKLRGIQVSPYSKELFICDAGNNRIQVFTLEGVFIRLWNIEKDLDIDNTPHSLDFLSNGDILVVSWAGIHRYSQFGIFCNTIINYIKLKHYMFHENCAYIIKVIKDNKIVVCDRLKEIIYVINENTLMFDRDL